MLHNVYCSLFGGRIQRAVLMHWEKASNGFYAYLILFCSHDICIPLTIASYLLITSVYSWLCLLIWQPSKDQFSTILVPMERIYGFRTCTALYCKAIPTSKMLLCSLVKWQWWQSDGWWFSKHCIRSSWGRDGGVRKKPAVLESAGSGLFWWQVLSTTAN